MAKSSAWCVFIVLPVRHHGSCSDLKMSPHANLVISFMRVTDFGRSISHAGKDCISEDGVFVILHKCSESVCVCVYARMCVRAWGGGVNSRLCLDSNGRRLSLEHDPGTASSC